MWLQRQAALPRAAGWWALVLVAGAGLGVALWGLRGGLRGAAAQLAPEWEQTTSARSPTGVMRYAGRVASARRVIGWGALWCAAICAGFGYAA
jgi:competence protein ComEC